MMFKQAIDFAKSFNLKFPAIIQAPMAGGITTPGLVSAVAEAGGLGSLATGYLTPAAIQDDIRAIQSLTALPFIANLFIPPESSFLDKDKIRVFQQHLNLYRQQLGMATENIDDLPEVYAQPFDEIIEVLISAKVKMVSFTFGILTKKHIERFKNKNVYLIGTATSVAEAKALAEAEIDAIVAQGWEAGGHRASFLEDPGLNPVNTLDLVKTIGENVNLPLIAAGGIMQATDIIAALKAGAVAVQMGTSFLPLAESGAHTTYKNALLAAATQADTKLTTLTRCYSGKLARSLETQFIKEVLPNSEIPDYPIPYYLRRSLSKEAAKQNNPELMALWCGMGIKRLNPTYTTIQKLFDGIQAEIKPFL